MLQPYQGFSNRWQEIRYGASGACVSAGWAQRANGSFENHHESLWNFDEAQGPAHVPAQLVVIRSAMNCCRQFIQKWLHVRC
jgi:hypothetical protein